MIKWMIMESLFFTNEKFPKNKNIAMLNDSQAIATSTNAKKLLTTFSFSLNMHLYFVCIDEYKDIK